MRSNGIKLIWSGYDVLKDESGQRGECIMVICTDMNLYAVPCATCEPGGGPRVVVSTAAFHAKVRGSVPGLGGLKETRMFLPHPRVKVSIVGSLRDRE